VPSAHARATSFSREEPFTVATASATTVIAPAGFGAPGPLAATGNGILYVASGSELYKLTGRRLDVAARAPQEILSAVAVANGTIYLGEATALQAVSPFGAVTTVARLSVGGLGLGPHKALYVVTGNAVERLVGNKLKPVARASQFDGLQGVPVAGLSLGSVDADGAGDLYISASGIGYDLYELTRTGHPRFVSPFRGANGKPAPLTIGPGGIVYGEWQNSIYEADGGGISLFQLFSGGTVPDYGGTFLPAFIAASGATGAPLYADADGGNGFSMDSAIVAIYPKHRVLPLWAQDNAT
jgi:hypothetical protein